ncbi:MAG: endonuclease/exonuclease/phosphatase family protein [Candidatus Chisholmbacteria bacterium]|nr:endonuclease/exonuclease/phosphatase family protein [Candidatus Chisholmbacteria bacterium]
MKVMSYNIFNGGGEHLPLILAIIKKESPDFLTLNEANTFIANNHKLLKHVAKDLNFPHFDIALSGHGDYHVAVFSKYKLHHITKLQPLERACLISHIDTDLGQIAIASLHLNPYAEDLRHPEIDLILDQLKSFDLTIITGDFNSLSRHDHYNPRVIQKLDAVLTKKLTTNDQLRFDAIDKIILSGYIDAAVELKRNNDFTVPTSFNEHAFHPEVRFDYIFISKPLKPHLKDYQVIKNNTTFKASDHYPVIAILS